VLIDDLVLSPLAKDSAGILARHIGEGGWVVLTNPVPHDDLIGRLASLT
jgi:hypothetical protein